MVTNRVFLLVKCGAVECVIGWYGFSKSLSCLSCLLVINNVFVNYDKSSMCDNYH